MGNLELQHGHYRVSADVGGTFTDVVVADASGRVSIGKAPTNRVRIYTGLAEALETVSQGLGASVSELLGLTDLFIYGTTTATNAIIEAKTAKTSLLVTQGFRDLLVLREAGKANQFDFRTPFPDPFIPRRLTFEIDERIDSQGQVMKPLNEQQLTEVISELRERNVAAVAVCFLWSIANPAHEVAAARLLTSLMPDVPFTLSHQLNPIIREYRRASDAALDASLKPLMQNHLREVAEDLRNAGFKGELLAATSSGGILHLDDVIARPIYTVKSGPALAPVAGVTYAEAEQIKGDIIVCDSGGTSFDVSLVQNGLIKLTRETWLGPKYQGHLMSLPSVDVKSIGAGGGSIAWVDPGGLLRVGPESAGADPGPACYRRGGRRPTVTDAALLLGYVDPEFFLGGRMDLSIDAARLAVESIGLVDLSIHEAAHSVMAVATENMVGAIRGITISEGVDPRDGTIIAGGGAAGLNIVPLARELGCRKVIVPRTAGALSACGAHYSDIMMDFTANRSARTFDFDFAAVNQVLAGLDNSMSAFAMKLRARGFSDFTKAFFVSAHYPYQVWDLEVRLTQGHFQSHKDVAELEEGFHLTHQQMFAVSDRSQEVECSFWRARLTARVPRILPAPARPRTRAQPQPGKRQLAYFPEIGEVDIPIFHGDTLTPNFELEGPALIAEATTTLVVYPNCHVVVSEFGSYVIAV